MHVCVRVCVCVRVFVCVCVSRLFVCVCVYLYTPIDNVTGSALELSWAKAYSWTCQTPWNSKMTVKTPGSQMGSPAAAEGGGEGGRVERE